MKKRIALVALLLLACSFSGKAQNASPLGGVGNLQFFDNSGALLTSGVVYVYVAGTTTQAAVYTDATGSMTQPNPVTFGSGARASIWLANSTFVKIVLCTQNDGAFCAGGDILFTADQVPIGSSSSGSSSSPFTGIFISSSASPATSGTLRLSSGDSTCWRNAAGSANLCWSKDANDLLSWAGGSFKLPEVAAPSGVATFDILWADNTAHRLKATNNGGVAAQYVLSGNDIGTTDQILGVHFGATQQTFSSTAPTTGQFLKFDGSNIVGTNSSPSSAQVDLTAQGANIGATTLLTPGANGFYRFNCYLVLTRAATTSSTIPVCGILWTDADTSVAQSVTTGVNSTANTVGTIGGAAVPLGVYAKSGTIIQYNTTGYASSGVTSMQYAIHIRLEGPF